MPKKNDTTEITKEDLAIISSAKKGDYKYFKNIVFHDINGDDVVFYLHNFCMAFLKKLIDIASALNKIIALTEDNATYKYIRNCFKVFVNNLCKEAVIKIKKAPIYKQSRKKELKEICSKLKEISEFFNNNINKKELENIIDSKEILPDPDENTKTCDYCTIS